MELQIICPPFTIHLILCQSTNLEIVFVVKSFLLNFQSKKIEGVEINTPTTRKSVLSPYVPCQQLLFR